jgi:hypothetical protein
VSEDTNLDEKLRHNLLTQHSNIRKAGVPIRDGKEDPHNRTEPLEKPEITQQVLRLAGVEAY